MGFGKRVYVQTSRCQKSGNPGLSAEESAFSAGISAGTFFLQHHITPPHHHNTTSTQHQHINTTPHHHYTIPPPQHRNSTTTTTQQHNNTTRWLATSSGTRGDRAWQDYPQNNPELRSLRKTQFRAVKSSLSSGKRIGRHEPPSTSPSIFHLCRRFFII